MASKNKALARKRRSRKAIDKSTIGQPTRYAQRHSFYELDRVSSEDATLVWKNRQITPLELYARRHNITEREYRAGDRLTELAHAAGISRIKISKYDPDECIGGGEGGNAPSEGQYMARKRLRAAFDAIHGQAGKQLVYSVIVMSIPLKELPSRGIDVLAEYPTSSHMMSRLKEALKDLSKHFGIS